MIAIQWGKSNARLKGSFLLGRFSFLGLILPGNRMKDREEERKLKEKGKK